MVRKILLASTTLGFIAAGVTLAIQSGNDDDHFVVNVTTYGMHPDSTGVAAGSQTNDTTPHAFFDSREAGTQASNDDRHELDLFLLIAVGCLIAGFIRFMALVRSMNGFGACCGAGKDRAGWKCMDACFGNSGVDGPGHMGRLHMGRWFEAATTVPMVMIGTVALLGWRDTSTHLLIGAIWVAFAGFGYVNDAVLNYEPAGEADKEGDDTEAAAIGALRSTVGPRRRGRYASVGGRRFGDSFKGKGQSDQLPESTYSVAQIVPILAQTVLIGILTYVITRLDSHDDNISALDSGVVESGHDDAVNNSRHLLVTVTVIFMPVWLLVQAVEITWAQSRVEIGICDMIASLWVAIYVLAVVFVMYMNVYKSDGGNEVYNPVFNE